MSRLWQHGWLVATNIAKSNFSTYKSYPDAPSLGPSQPSMNWSKHFSSVEVVQWLEFLAWFTWINVSAMESLGGTLSVSSDPPISAIPSPIIANCSSIIILFKQIKIILLALHISLLTSYRYKIENISDHTRVKKNTNLQNFNIIIGCKYI